MPGCIFWSRLNPRLDKYRGGGGVYYGYVVAQKGSVVCKKIKEDIDNCDIHNADEMKVYQSNYFAFYNGNPVILHSNKFLTSWSISGIIFLNRNNGVHRESILKHEYGHILQEAEMGTGLYLIQVAIPSVLYNLGSRFSEKLSDNYYKL